MKLEEKLISLRKQKGLTQLQVAEEIDVSRQAISKWESGVAVPSIDNLKFLSKLYGVSLDYLLNDDVESPGQQEETQEKQEKRGRPKWVIFAICIIAVAIVGLLFCKMVISKKTNEFNFNEMEREKWETGETDGFSMSW